MIEDYFTWDVVKDFLYTGSIWVVPVVLAVTLHEAAHAGVAYMCGDTTARDRGRLSINPLVHIDRFGTVMLPALLFILKSPFIFGWAKPVPVDFHNLPRPRRDTVWIAIAGPATNIILALAAAVLTHGVLWLPTTMASTWMLDTLYIAILVNVFLAVFNMLPVPPLDGGRIVVSLLPPVLARPLARIEPFGIWLVLALLFLLPFAASLLEGNLSMITTIVALPVFVILDFIIQLSGLRFQI